MNAGGLLRTVPQGTVAAPGAFGVRSWCETALPEEEASSADGDEVGGEATDDWAEAEGR